MSTLQKLSTTTLEARLSILFSDAANLRLQLYELIKLRYRVRQAELWAAKSRRTDNGPRARLDEGPGHAATVVRIEQAARSQRASATASRQAGPDTFSEAGPHSGAHNPNPQQRDLAGPGKRRKPMEAWAAYCEPKASANVVVQIRKQKPI
jgi:hypothetical protein